MKQFIHSLFKQLRPATSENIEEQESTVSSEAVQTGLTTTISPGNTIDINPNTKFTDSKIIIVGENNSIKIEGILEVNRLVVNLKGDNKKIIIKSSNKKINNLKIVSIRGNCQVIEIGENLSCGGLEIQMNDGDESLKIGDNCLFSWGIKMRTSDGHSIVDLESNMAVNLPKDIFIADRIWIGEDVYICKGVTLASDTVIAAKSVVTKSSIEGNIILAGNPAKIVKKGISWHRQRPRLYNEKRKACS